MAAVREIAAGGETRVLVGMPPVDQAPVAERHWFLRVLPTLQWLVLGILVLVTAIFYEDVNAMRLAARAAVLGSKATKDGGVVHETGVSQAPSNKLELGRKGGPRAPLLTAPPAPDSAAPVPMAGRAPKVSVVTLDNTGESKDGDEAKDVDPRPVLPPPIEAGQEVEAGEKTAPRSDPAPSSGSDLRPGGPVPLPDVPASIGGEWRSIGKTQPLTGEDLSAPGALEAAAEKRSFRKEIIVMVANEGGAILAANAVANLRSVGIEHYLIVTNEPKSCDLLMNGPWGITCGYTSYLKNHERLKDYQLLAEEGATPFRLWWVRFHFLDRLVQLGYNPMYIDTDVSFRVNPYPLLKGPFKEYSLFAQDETGHFNGVNIGWIYAQNARPNGRVRWALNQTVTRMMEIL